MRSTIKIKINPKDSPEEILSFIDRAQAKLAALKANYRKIQETPKNQWDLESMISDIQKENKDDNKS
jgi:cystathionine beta-lyase family protein involved in aluminum resistance